MGDDAEYESAQQEEERRLAAGNPNPSGVRRLVDTIVDARLPKGKPGQPRVIRADEATKKRP